MSQTGKLTGGRTILVRILLALALVMTFRAFQFFPGMPNVQEAWFLLCFLVVLFVYPFWKLRMGLRFSWFESYLFLLMFADVALTAWQAHQVFGQPLLYGVLSQRNMALIAMLLIFLNALRTGMVDLTDIEAALLFLAWATFILYSAMRLFLNPADFNDFGVGFVTQPMVGTEQRFKFQSFFILFGAFYYAMLGMRTRRARYYLAAVALFLGAGLGVERGFTVFAPATLLFFLYRLRGMGRAFVAVAKVSCAVIVLTVVVYAISPGKVSTRIGSFSDAFTVLTTGNPSTSDASANNRAIEILRVFPYIQEHPLLGAGVISNQWQLANGSVLGQNFYASDIGIIGVEFSFGIVGLLLFLYQYRFAWSAAKKLPDSYYSPLLDATKAILLYTVLSSVQLSDFVWAAEVPLFFIVLMREIARQRSSLRFSDARTG